MGKTPSKPAAQTPLMRQYLSIKEQHPDALLFFRLGDFYELFYDDAVVAAKELEITLTSRQKERGVPVPMCGVPHHAVSNYIARLIRRGFKVAVCEQTEAPTKGKKLVAREVMRVITPGTAMEAGQIEPNDNNYLVACFPDAKQKAAGLAYAELSTGEFRATEFSGEDWHTGLLEEILHLTPSEVLRPQTGKLTGELSGAQILNNGATVNFVETPLEDWNFDLDHTEQLLKEHFGVQSLDGFGLTDKPLAIAAAGAILHYLRETQRKALTHIERIVCYQQGDALVLDSATVTNLELTEPVTGNDRETTLLRTLDESVTAPGARLLKNWLLRPSVQQEEIEARFDAVETLGGETVAREELRETLKNIRDLERLLGKCTMETATPRDLLALRQSFEQLPALRQQLKPLSNQRLQEIHAAIDKRDELTDLHRRIAETLSDNPPATVNDLGIIRPGCHTELDELRGVRSSGQQYIAELEARERKRTGINSLKVRFNNIFGYYIEISKANLDRVPEDYDRKQTLVNAERYITPELKEYEEKVLTAEEKISELEKRLFAELRSAVAACAGRLQQTAAAIAQLDVLASFAHSAQARHYCRPSFTGSGTSSGELVIVEGRHPVIEKLMEGTGERFVPNDLYLNDTSAMILLVTGPNMGGKSTYLRQAALTCLLAQMGSFVPAREARLPVVDRIYTRIGASDNLARGRSTFLVEMAETATILNTATPKSLILLDEVGRGTSTFDGLAIAWAVVEFLHTRTRAKTLFATHYHELTELAQLLDSVGNIHVEVKETADSVIFLHRISSGAANKSYGIEVAKLAGLPHEVIKRARQVLQRHEQHEEKISHELSPGSPAAEQLPLLTPLDQKIVEELRQVDLDQLRPLDALNLLAELKKQLE